MLSNQESHYKSKCIIISYLGNNFFSASISNKQPSVDPIKPPGKEKPQVSRQFSREIEKTEQPSEEVDKDLNSKSGPQIRVRKRKLFFLFLSQSICCGCSKELSHRDSSFEHQKHMFKQIDKKIITILRQIFCLTVPMISVCLTKH